MSVQPAAEKEDVILDAALALFAEQGFHGTRVPELARRAGVGTGTLYLYFADKDALVNALYRRCNERLLDNMVEGFPVHATVRAQFGEMWQRLWRFAETYPDVLTFLELHDHRSYIDEGSSALQDQLLAPIVALLAEAQAKGELKPMAPMTLVSIAWGAFIGLHKGVLKDHLVLDDELRSTSEEAVWHALRVAP